MVTRFFDVFSGKDIDDPDVGRAVNVERVTQSTELQPHVAVASVSAGLVAIYYVISQGGADWVWLTLLPIIAIAISALGSWLKYRDRPIPHHVHPRSVLRASIMLCLFGALWGGILSTMIFMVPDNPWMLILITVGMCSVTISVSYFLPAAAMTSCILLLTPVAVVTGLLNPVLAPVLVALYVIYMTASYFALNRSFRMMLVSLETRHANDKLLQKAKQDSVSKNKFIAAMSHELRTPLNAISGYAQLTKLNPAVDTIQLTRSMQNIINASSHLVNLIDDVLNISKLEADEITYSPEVIVTKETMDEIATMLQGAATDKQLPIKFHNDSNAKIFVDRLRFRQVLLNLLNNAIKYTPEGGSVELGCFQLDNSVLRIYVSDTGVGIPKADQQDIFKQFQRASNVVNLYPGTGLGLYHSKRLVEEMGGKIFFESLEAGGTTFFLEFPLHL